MPTISNVPAHAWFTRDASRVASANECDLRDSLSDAAPDMFSVNQTWPLDQRANASRAAAVSEPSSHSDVHALGSKYQLFLSAQISRRLRACLELLVRGDARRFGSRHACGHVSVTSCTSTTLGFYAGSDGHCDVNRG